ncbi:protein kinase domain-containing protein [Clostridium folliculivorans]|uniref:protein kinase domain-containing protein n=1 Tax=Clostridium folliculivorans TaxID=2886038 RepID=UPI0021C2F352|nr:protein kinase [Clostridium folliculivorans]GKU29325.1 hypothetical protein CFB3_14310 [Clostridium folliculivorans]
MSRESLVGKTVLGYEVQEVIGTGGFGRVYKAIKFTGQDKYYAAIKHISVPSEEQYNDILSSMGGNYKAAENYFEEMLDDIKSEINTLFSLSKKNNKNIVTYYDHDIIKNSNPLRYEIVIRMEYLTPVSKYIKKNDVTIEDVINLGIDIGSAIEICHSQGIIHRDVKDDNIFINEDGNFKLGDFGISKVLLDTKQAISMKGTPIFMAPEVIKREKYDNTVDIYSLGIILYKLLNYNRIPFLPPYPEHFTSKDIEDAIYNKRLSGCAMEPPINASYGLDKVILKACDKYENRYKNVSELISDLVQIKKLMPNEELSRILFEKDSEKKNVEKERELDETCGNGQAGVYRIETLDNYKGNDIFETESNKKAEYNKEKTGNILELKDGITKELKQEENIGKKSISKVKMSKKRTAIITLVVAATIIGIIITTNMFKLSNIKLDNSIIGNDTLSSIKEVKESEGLGNLSGNFNLMALMVADQNNLFFSMDDGIVQARNDYTEQKLLIKEDAFSLNKLSEDIYYINKDYIIKKVNIRTKESTVISQVKALKMIVLHDSIYYIGKEDGNLYKTSSIGKDTKKIINEKVINFAVTNNKILYATEQELNMLDLNSNQVQKLNEYSVNFSLYENCILFIKDNALYKSTIDMKHKKKIVDDAVVFTANKEWIYYINTNKELRLTTLSGSNNSEVDNMKDIEFVNINSGVGYAIDKDKKIKYFRTN